MGCQDWRIMAKENPSDDEYTSVVLAGVMIHGKIIGKGIGKSSRVAKITAANKAWEVLDGLTPPDFRHDYKCDCIMKGEGRDEKIDDGDTAI